MRTLPMFCVAGCLLLVAACDKNNTFFDTLPSSTDAQLQELMHDANLSAVTAPQPEDPALVELGRALFFDKILSGNENISCATCHHPSAATGDALPVSLGEGGFGLGENRSQGGGELIARNAPHVFNGGVAGVHTMFWDSRVRRDPKSGDLTTPEPGLNGPDPALAAVAAPLNSALAAQAMFPVTSHEEMRGQPESNEIADADDNAEVWALLMTRLGTVEQYRQLFAAAYPGADFESLTFGHAARAIAAFEREAFTALDSPVDRYMGGETTALSDSEKRGAILFCGKARCVDCHSGPLFSDFKHYATGTPQVGPGKNEPFEDLGLALETGDATDNYKFRTPPLRNVALTGPWMHDGAFTSLEAAVRHHLNAVDSLANYDASQLPPLFAETVDNDPDRNLARTEAIDSMLASPIGLTNAEFADLMAFLHAMTDPSSLNLAHTMPAEVPSGLPVND